MALTRKQAKQLSQAHTGYNNEQFRTAYMNAKNAVHESAGLTGKNKREAARNIVAGITAPEHEAIAVPKASFSYTPEITPLKRMEGYTEVGPLTVSGVEVEPQAKQPVYVPTPVEGGTPVTQDPAYLAKRAKTDAWYQFQHEVDAYNRAHNNYRPTQDSHAYQAWLEEEFNRIYPNMVNGVRNSSSVYHEPTVQDLTRLQNAKLNYGALPFSNSEKEMYGVDLNGDMFGLRDGSGVAGGGYASGKGISAGAKEKANNQFNAALGTMLFGPALADIIAIPRGGVGGEGANASSAVPQTNAYYQGYPRVMGQGRAASTTGKASRTYYQTVGNAANADAHTAAGFGRAVDVQPGSFTGLIDNAGNTARTAAELYRPGTIVDETVKLPRFIRAIGSLARGFEKGGVIKRTK